MAVAYLQYPIKPQDAEYILCHPHLHGWVAGDPYLLLYQSDLSWFLLKLLPTSPMSREQLLNFLEHTVSLLRKIPCLLPIDHQLLSVISLPSKQLPLEFPSHLSYNG